MWALAAAMTALGMNGWSGGKKRRRSALGGCERYRGPDCMSQSQLVEGHRGGH